MARSNNEAFKLKVRATFISPVLGTVSKDKEVFTSYIADLTKGDEVPSPMPQDMADVKEARGWTGFMEEGGKPYIMNYIVKGFLKHAGNVLKERGVAVKNLKSKIDDYIFVFPRKIFLNGDKADKPMERSLRVMTMQGPRVSLAKSDYMEEGTTIEFEIDCPYPCEISRDDMLKILDHGKYMGIGQWRNAGNGSFTYEILE